MKSKIKKIVREMLTAYHARKYHRFYYNILKNNNLNVKVGGGKIDWMHKWSGLGIKPDSVYYSVFSHYVGDDPNIVPENICHDVIERILNPVYYDGYYTDKNNFDKLLPQGFLPTTILRKMNGFYYDADYQMQIVDENVFRTCLDKSGFQKIIIKPTLETCSGRGVMLARYEKGVWRIVGDDNILTFDYVQKKCGMNFVIQEAMEQSDYINQFNPTSVNTLRLIVYRSVKTNECTVPSAIMRIGGKGSIMDNAHAGGGYTAIKMDGTLGDCVLDQYGHVYTTFNGIDFKQEHKISDFDKVIVFAKTVGKYILHHRLLALDIMIDKQGNPRLIEFNTGQSGAYSMWLFQFAGMPAFGEYTDEIIDYCKGHLADVHYSINI